DLDPGVFRREGLADLLAQRLVHDAGIPGQRAFLLCRRVELGVALGAGAGRADGDEGGGKQGGDPSGLRHLLSSRRASVAANLTWRLAAAARVFDSPGTAKVSFVRL